MRGKRDRAPKTTTNERTTRLDPLPTLGQQDDSSRDPASRLRRRPQLTHIRCVLGNTACMYIWRWWGGGEKSDCPFFICLSPQMPRAKQVSTSVNRLKTMPWPFRFAPACLVTGSRSSCPSVFSWRKAVITFPVKNVTIFDIYNSINLPQLTPKLSFVWPQRWVEGWNKGVELFFGSLTNRDGSEIVVQSFQGWVNRAISETEIYIWLCKKIYGRTNICLYIYILRWWDEIYDS